MRLIPDKTAKDTKTTESNLADELKYLQFPENINKLQTVKEVKLLLDLDLAEAKKLCDILFNIATRDGKVFAVRINDIAYVGNDDYQTLCDLLKLYPAMVNPGQTILKKLKEAESPNTWKII